MSDQPKNEAPTLTCVPIVGVRVLEAGLGGTPVDVVFAAQDDLGWSIRGNYPPELENGILEAAQACDVLGDPTLASMAYQALTLCHPYTAEALRTIREQIDQDIDLLELVEDEDDDDTEDDGEQSNALEAEPERFQKLLHEVTADVEQDVVETKATLVELEAQLKDLKELKELRGSVDTRASDDNDRATPTMTRKEIARQLRERVLAKGELAAMAPAGTDIRAILDAQSDEQMIDSYIRCSGCQELFVSVEVADDLIAKSTSADDWLQRVRMAQDPHSHSN